MNWIHRIIVTYMVAATMHVPFPVFDGDNLKSGEIHPTAAAADNDDNEVDFIFLGCDPPDDSDDGPVDDDPENGSSSASGHLLASPRLDYGSIVQIDLHQFHFAWSALPEFNDVAADSLRDEIPFRYFSFGKLCQIGIVCLRC
ncbi:hypothetical protein [Rubinisphaera sp.]|uniref:hypothetical protein n=1 Tax=Rubinisphaera sp. TaxID=2024857 RepID=UPI0025D1429C|nr:hypothetical protein [Rubinisphaera sp.]